MSYLIEFPMAASGNVVVEVDEEQLGFAPAATDPGKIAATATETFEDALEHLLPPVEAIAERMKALTPDEVEVELGVKLSAEAGAIIAKAAGEANFTVKLRWTKRP